MGAVERGTSRRVHRAIEGPRAEEPFSYAAYGLHIASDLCLMGPTPHCAGSPADVQIRLGSVPESLLGAGPEQGCVRVTPDEACFHWDGLGTYLIRGGREIVVEPATEAGEDTLGLAVLGSALGVLLHQRGLLTFHASAVALEGGAVAFLGNKGEGKSALATAMYARGCGVAADDIVALDTQDAARCMLLPAYPQLKLWPEVAAWLGDDPETLPRLHPHLVKRARAVPDRFPQLPLPLRCIYVLAEGTDLQVERLRPPEAFVELVRHAYALRFLGTAGVTARHFEQCTALARSVPTYRLRRPRDLAVLSDVAQLVEEHQASTQLEANAAPPSDVSAGRSGAL